MKSKNVLDLLVINSQLQSDIGPNTEPVTTIELETPEETHEDRISLDVNIPPENKPEDTHLISNYSLK